MKVLLLIVFIIFAVTDNSSAFLETIFGKFLPSHQCPIALYNPKDSSFTGRKIYADTQTFHPLLKTLSTYAKECDVKINIKQSFIQEDSSKSPIMLRDYDAMAFRLGQAIEFELVDRHNQLLCNRRCLKKRLSRLSGLPDAKCFLQKLSHNSDLQRDTHTRTIIMKRKQPNQTLMNLHDIRKELQKKCQKLQMN